MVRTLCAATSQTKSQLVVSSNGSTLSTTCTVKLTPFVAEKPRGENESSLASGLKTPIHLRQVGDWIRCVHAFDSPTDGRCLVAAATDDGRVKVVDTRGCRAGHSAPVRSALKTG
jgi:hypothetical protein